MMTPIASQLEAALPANDDDNGPVTLPASVVREAVREIQRLELEIAHWWDDLADYPSTWRGAEELRQSDQQNARWLAWLLAGIAIGAAMVPFAEWVG